jgi:hypothetical protein
MVLKEPGNIQRAQTDIFSPYQEIVDVADNFREFLQFSLPQMSLKRSIFIGVAVRYRTNFLCPSSVSA